MDSDSKRNSISKLKKMCKIEKKFMNEKESSIFESILLN